MKNAVKGLNEVIDGINDREHQDISRAMLVLITAVAVGPDPARLARETGCATEFVEGLASRMRKAGLWLDELVDNREWTGAVYRDTLCLFTFRGHTWDGFRTSLPHPGLPSVVTAR